MGKERGGHWKLILMRKKMKKIMRLTGVIVMLFIVCSILQCTKVSAATQTNLLPDKTYKYDLNKDGKKEEIKYKVVLTYGTGYEENIVKKCKVTIYINRVAAWSKNYDGFVNGKIQLSVADTLESDKQMELFLSTQDRGGWVGGGELLYLRYKNKKLVMVQNLNAVIKKKYTDTKDMPSLTDKKVYQIDGKGNLKLRVCALGRGYDIKTQTCMDYVHFDTKLVLKSGEFRNVTSREFKVLEKQYIYNEGKRHICDLRDDIRVKAASKIYKDTKLKAVSATVKKDEELRIISVYYNGKTVLWKVKTTGGKVGYINPKKFPGLRGTYHV